MRAILLPVLAALLAVGSGSRLLSADEPEAPSLADRAKILRAEMRRGPASDLAPYLAPDANPALRRQAIRALGRIGDRAGATQWLVKLLGGGADLVDVLRAAGLSGAAALEGPVVGHLAATDPKVQAAALEALGWIAATSLGAYGTPSSPSDVASRAAAAAARMLHAKDPGVQAAALGCLALAGQEGYLERVFRWVDVAESPALQAEAAFGAWFLGRERRTAAKQQDPQWGGDPRLATRVLAWAASQVPERRLDAVRVLGLLAPLELDEKSPVGAMVGALVLDPDPRVIEETLARVLTAREGAMPDAWVAACLGHDDPTVREEAAKALGAHGSPAAVSALKAQVAKEKDERVRVALGAALVKAGKADDVAGLLKPSPDTKDPVALAQRAVRIFGGSEDPAVRERLIEQVKALPRAPLVTLELLGALEEHKSPAFSDFLAESLKDPDPYVRGAAASLIGKQHLAQHLDALSAALDAARTPAERAVRQSVVEAWVELVKAEDADPATVTLLKGRILEAAKSDPGFTARAVARKAAKDLGLEGAPTEDPLQPNDWRGLPRPKTSVLGSKVEGGPWLDEEEILALADALAKQKPEFVVECQVGDAVASCRLAIDPSEAPVHAVSFLLAARAGVYDGTVWHRVVPSFVIQGGDPHGDGSGDAGWSLPDEITRASFVRGALGMPKDAIRDTGGCQLFVMHSPYRPLDGRYTCYGHVVSGMETVDKIRVGDTIRKVLMVVE